MTSKRATLGVRHRDAALESGDTSPQSKWRPYPKYKDSGIEWLGDIPAHWEAKRLKLLSFINMGQSPSSDIVNTSGEGLPFLQGNADFGKEHPTAQTFCPAPPKIAEFGDVLLSVRAPVGALNLADQKYGIGRGLCAIRPNIQILERTFCHYVLQIARHQLDELAKGSTYDAVSWSEVSCLIIPLPSIKELRAIASFLDHETAKIDALIEKKERLIDLLQEKRTALITQAVTKGLDPNVPMKDSGVEWLGNIPAHWEVRKWRYCCRINEGQVDPKDDRYRDRVMIAPNHIESGTGRILFIETAEEQGAISGKYKVRCGELIYSKIRPALNKVCIAKGDWLCSADMYPVEVTVKDLHTRYLLNFILSEAFVHLMVDESMRVAMPKVNRETLTACPILVPLLREQGEIVDFLDREMAKIDALIAIIHEAIDRIKEYRSALISGAVTGKIDVQKV